MQAFTSYQHHGVHVHHLQKPMNKMINIQVSLIVPIRRERWTPQSMIPLLMAQGTEQFSSAKEFEAELQRVGAIDFQLKHNTWSDCQVITMQVMLVHQRYLPGTQVSLSALLHLLGDVLFRPHFCNRNALVEEWETLKKQQVRRMEAEFETDAEWTLHHLWQHIASVHPSAWPLYGFAEEMDAWHPDDLIAVFHQMLQEASLHVFVVGAVAEQEVLEAAFQSFERGNFAILPKPLFLETRAKRPPHYIEDIRTGGSHVAIAIHVGNVFSHEAAYFMLTNWLTLLPDSLLMQIARTEQQWVYRINTHLREDTGYLLLHTTLEWPNRHAFAKTVHDVLLQLQENPLAENELRDLATACARKLKGRSDLPWRAIEFQLNALLAGSSCTLPHMIESFSSVTAEEIQLVAKNMALDTVHFVGGDSK